MKIISFGSLEIDYYFKNDINIGYSIGGTSVNTLFNLDKLYNTEYFYNGYNIIDYNQVYNTKFILLNECNNKKIYKLDKDFSSICPLCNRLSKFIYKNIDINIILNNIDSNDKIIIDNLNEDSLDIINNTDNDKYLLIKYVSNINEIDLDLLNSLVNKFKLVSINYKAYKFIRDKYNIDYIDLYDILKPNILIIYNEINNIIVYNDNVYEKEVEDFKFINHNGCFEAFSSSFIDYLIKCEVINEKGISDAYINGMRLAIKASIFIGDSEHIYHLNKINNYNECICNTK